MISCTENATNYEEPINENANLTNIPEPLAKANYKFADHYIVKYTNESKFLNAVAELGGTIKS
jgi:hypothetical protein